MKDPHINSYFAKNRADWRQWLMTNHGRKKNVWLVIYHKTKKPSKTTRPFPHLPNGSFWNGS